MSIIKYTYRKFKAIISYFEESTVSPINIVFTFCFAILLRNFIEVFSDNEIISLLYVAHYSLFYLALALSIILLFRFSLKIEIIKIIKVVFPAFIFLVMAPLLDMLLSPGNSYDMSYLLPGIHDNILLRFFTFFGEFSNIGITPGMKIEIFTILLMAGIYFYSKTLKILKSIFYTFLLYIIIFSFVAMPFLIKSILFTNLVPHENFETLIIDFYLLLIFVFGIISAYYINKDYFLILLRDMRFFRLLHYELMFILGIAISLSHYELSFLASDLFSYILASISVSFAWIFSIMSNNIADYKIDAISNRERPLFNNIIDHKKYENISWVFLILSLVYAYAVDDKVFFLISIFIGSYYIYSMPPLRIKRMPLLSKAFIALNSLIILILGFSITTGAPILIFKYSFMPIFLIGFTFILNFIDIKDYEGDKSEGVLTLPVILGLKRSKIIIGIFFILSYFTVYFITKQISFVIPLLLLGLIQFYFINKKHYNEKYIFIVHSISIIIFLVYLSFHPIRFF